MNLTKKVIQPAYAVAYARVPFLLHSGEVMLTSHCVRDSLFIPLLYEVTVMLVRTLITPGVLTRIEMLRPKKMRVVCSYDNNCACPGLHMQYCHVVEVSLHHPDWNFSSTFPVHASIVFKYHNNKRTNNVVHILYTLQVIVFKHLSFCEGCVTPCTSCTCVLLPITLWKILLVPFLCMRVIVVHTHCIQKS